MRPELTSSGDITNGMSNGYMDTAGRKPTTTVSTIAIKAADHTRIVLAVLKSTNWVHIKIHEMTPSILDVGNSLEEASRMCQHHNELMSKLASKQGNVEELLAQADGLVTQQKKPEADVYEAMADSLGKAWKELMRHLQLRGVLLEHAVEFFKWAKKHSEHLDQIEAQMHAPLTDDLATAQRMLQQHMELKREMQESAVEFMGYGEKVIGKLREVGRLADNLNLHPDDTAKACRRIEDHMMRLNAKRAQVEDLWEQRRLQLEMCIEACKIYTSLRTMETWIHEKREIIERMDLGDSESATEYMLKEIDQIYHEAMGMMEQWNRLNGLVQQLSNKGYIESGQLRRRADDVKRQLDELLAKIELRRQLLQAALSFYKQANSALTKMSSLEMEFTSSKTTYSGEALFRRHAEIQQQIQEIATPPIHQGRALLQKVGEANGRGVRRKLDELERRLADLDALMAASRADQMAKAQKQNDFLKDLDSLGNWLRNNVEGFLASHRDMGNTLPAAAEFTDGHRALGGELASREPDLGRLRGKLHEVTEPGDPNSEELRRKVNDLQDRFDQAKKCIASRVDLGQLFQQFLKTAVGLSADMDTFEATLMTNPDLSEKPRLEDLWFSILRTLDQLKQQGQRFLMESAHVNDYQGLDIPRARAVTEKLLEHFGGRHDALKKLWEDWLNRQQQEKEARDQFNKLANDVKRLIDWINGLMRDPSFTYSRFEDPPAIVADRQQRLLDDIIPTVKKVQVEVESKLREAEALAARSPDLRMEKDRLVGELVQAHQRFTNHVGEFQGLTITTVPFFSNLHQVDETIRKVEEQFRMAQIPQDVPALERLIQDHNVARNTVNEMINFSQNEGQQIVDKERRYPDHTPEVRREVGKILGLVNQRRRKWDDIWNSQHRDLEQRLQQENERERQDRDNRDKLNKWADDARKLIDYLSKLHRDPALAYIRFEDPPLVVSERQQRILDEFIPAVRKVFAETENQIRIGQALQVTSETRAERDRLVDELLRAQQKSQQILSDYQILTAMTVTFFKNLNQLDETIQKFEAQFHPSRLPTDQMALERVIQDHRNAKTTVGEVIRYTRSEGQQVVDKERQQEISPEVRREVDKIPGLIEQRARRWDDLWNEQQRMLEQRQQQEKDARDAWKKFADDCRKLIDWLNKLLRDPSLQYSRFEDPPLTVVDRQQRILDEFVPLVRKVQAEVEKQLHMAEQLGSRIDTYGEKERLLNEFLQAHQKFQNQLSHYQLLTNMTVSFFKNLNQLDEGLGKVQETFRPGSLPQDPAKLERLRQDFAVAKQTVGELLNFARNEGQTIVSKEREQEISPEVTREVQKIPGLVEQRNRRWEDICREHEKFLDEQAGLAKFDDEYRQLMDKINRLGDQLRQFDGNLGSKEGVKAVLQALPPFLKDVDQTDPRVRNYVSNAEAMLAGPYRGNPQVRQKSDDVKNRWADFMRALDAFRNKLAAAQNFFDVYDQIDYWCNETVDFIRDTAKKATEAKASDEVNNLMGAVENYIKREVPVQDGKMRNLEDEGRKVYGEASEHKVAPIRKKYKEIVDSLHALNDQLFGLAESLREKEAKAREPVMTPPQFVQPLRDGQVLEGSRFEFMARVIGDPTPEISWFKDGISIQNNPDYVTSFVNGICILKIEETFTADSATFTCRAKNPAGSAETSARLTVKESPFLHIQQEQHPKTDSEFEPNRPRFIIELQNVTVVEGEPARLDCTIVGYPEPEVIWFKELAPVKESPDLRLLFEGDRCILHIPKSALNDAGVYKCVARNNLGESTSFCKLTVIPRGGQHRVVEEMFESHTGMSPSATAPEFIKPLRNVSVKLGSTAVLDCIIIGNPKPVEATIDLDADAAVFWREDWLVCLGGSPEPLDRGALETRYAPPPVAPKMDFIPPQFTRTLISAVCSEGDSVTFEGHVTGKPAPEIIWYKNGVEIAPGEAEMSYYNGDVSLTLYNLSLKDSCQIKCLARNPGGAATSSAHLLVRPPMVAPDFIDRLVSKEVVEGDSLRWEVKIIGDPVPKVTWYRQDSPIKSCQECQILDEGDGVHVLYIPQLDMSDAGQFTVRAENDAGEARSTADLVVRRKGTEPGVYYHVTQVYQEKQELGVEVESHQQGNIQNTVKTTTALYGQTLDGMPVNFGKRPLGANAIMEAMQPPHFVKPLQDKRVPVNSKVVLDCQVTGIPEPTVKWLKEGESVHNIPDVVIEQENDVHRLIIPRATRNESGRYTCQAFNPAGSKSSSAMLILSAPVPPPGGPGLTPQQPQLQKPGFMQQKPATIAEQKKQVMGELENVVQQPRVFKGNFYRPKSERWLEQRYGGAEDDKDSIPSSAAELQCLSEGEADDGSSKPRPEFIKRPASSQAEPTTGSATARPPQFLRIPTDLTIYEKQMARFDAKIVGRPYPSVEWFKDENPVRESNRYKTLVNQEGFHSLMISNAELADGGVFVCIAKNSGGEARFIVNLTVLPLQKAEQAPPQFTQKFPSQTLDEGDSFILHVQVNNDPPPKLQWYKDNVPLYPGKPYRIDFGVGESSLYIVNAGPEDAGWYQCEAVTPMGTTIHRARISVKPSKPLGEPRRPLELGKGLIPGEFEEGEVITLRHIEKAPLRPPDEEPEPLVRAPKFIEGPLDQMNLREGQAAHFEAQLIPVNDPNLKVIWLFNGLPMQCSSRVAWLFDFGFATMDIKPVYPEDSGTYTCLAINQLGEDQVSARMQVAGVSMPGATQQAQGDAAAVKGGIKSRTFLAESQRRSTAASLVDEGEVGSSKQPPQFTKPLKTVQAIDGASARFDTKVIPSTDSSMKIAWFHNERPLNLGSRFRVYHDFGIVSLDISKLQHGDAGTYKCVATNARGSAEATAQLTVTVPPVTAVTNGATVTSHQQQPSPVNVTTQNGNATVQVGLEPVFLEPLKDVCTQEGKRTYFETKVEPRKDPSLRVNWFKDGAPLKLASRIRTMFDFGAVSLSLQPTYPEDSGTYVCVAVNRAGKTEASARLSCEAKESILKQTRHEGSLLHIQQLEGQSVRVGPILPDRKEETESITRPSFVSQLKPSIKAKESENVHLECQIKPVNDPKLSVQWQRDGQPLMFANRYRLKSEFGRIFLDILSVNAEDSGTYCVIISNSLGTAQSSCQLQVEVLGKTTLLLDPLRPEGLDRIQQLECPPPIDNVIQTTETHFSGPPKILRPLPTSLELNEHENLHIETTIEPANDSGLLVEWLHNGKPLNAGSRIQPLLNFDHVSLDIGSLIAEDSGTYSLNIVNVRGRASASFELLVKPDEAVKTGTRHQQSLQKIQALEAMEKFSRPLTSHTTAKTPPSFSQALTPASASVDEGATIHLECQVQPRGDPSLVIDWLKDSKPVPMGHRFQTFRDFGFATLDILTMYPEDSGVYTCIARNEAGQCTTEAAIQCHGKQAIQLQSQHPNSVQKIAQLEAHHVDIETDQSELLGPPQFLRELRDAANLKEGEFIHLECHIQPANDPQLSVQWYVNGVPLQFAHRFQIRQEFGVASLNILYVYPEDSGTYCCVAKNAAGEACSQCTVTCRGNSGLQLQALNPKSLQRIQELENPKSILPLSSTMADAKILKPEFLARFQDMENLREGQSVHLECSLKPAKDPQLTVEFLCNGKPLPASHRFRTAHDFGYVSLDILYVSAEDSGVYVCRATNALGTAETSCKLSCSGKRSVETDTVKAESWKKIREMEAAAAAAQPMDSTEMAPASAPEIVKELPEALQLKEGQSAHLECFIAPKDDPRLVVQWLFNSKPLKQGHRFRDVHDFGYAALEILYVYPEDSGIYCCKVTNDAGKATTSCKILCQGNTSLLLEPQQVDSWQRIQELESMPAPAMVVEERSFPKPQFSSSLKTFDDLVEGDCIRLETCVKPVDDPLLKITWLRNGKPLPQGSRFQPAYDFGYISLDISTIYPEDSGIYACRASNNAGETTISCSVRCQGKQSIISETFHAKGLAKIKELETPTAVEPIVEDRPLMPPVFTTTLVERLPACLEGSELHFECFVEPAFDPNLKVSWLHNGRPFSAAHRYHTLSEFGYISFDILYAFPEDSGRWTCKATNELGSVECSVLIEVEGNAAIDKAVQHPKSWAKIQQIEAPKPLMSTETEVIFEAPEFIQPLIGTVERIEGQPAHFECRLTPINDPEMRVSWYHNGKLLQQANRFMATSDLGYVALDIAHTHTSDSGAYQCIARNSQGEARTELTLNVQDRGSLLLDTQRPESLQKIRQLESPSVQPMEKRKELKTKPAFEQTLNSCLDLIEGQPAHFECIVTPVRDPNLKVEWFHNKKPLVASSRITPTYDFGYVALDIQYCLPEDTGSYHCRATNKLGRAECSGELRCTARTAVVLESQREASFAKIQEMESLKPLPLPAAEQTTFQKPSYTKSLQNVDDVAEGAPAHFECQLIPVKDPKLTVEWYFNDKPLKMGNRISATNNFGCISLQFAAVTTQDSGIYICRARNELGEAVTTAALTVKASAALVLDSQRPKSLAKIQQLEEPKLAAAAEEKETFEKPAFVEPLRNLEKLNEGDKALLEGRLKPANDPTLTVSWLLNGKPLDLGSRFHEQCNFGYASLELEHVKPEDSGMYTCKATSLSGEASTSATLKVKGYETIIRDTGNPLRWQKIQDLEKPVSQQPVVQEQVQRPKPRFTSGIPSLDNVADGAPVHLELFFEPAKDETLKVEWTQNGQPIPAGQLTKITTELGYTSLDISNAYSQHSGVYTVKLTNAAGEAAISASVKVQGAEAVVTETKHQQSLAKIQALENPKALVQSQADTTFPAPRFLTQISNAEVHEGEKVSFECQVEPAKDPDLQVSWFLNGNPLAIGSKYIVQSDFGFVALELSYAYPEDSGVYCCKVKNKAGAVSCSAILKCHGKSAIVSTPQNVAAATQIAKLELAQKSSTTSATEAVSLAAPIFVIGLGNLGEIVEGSSAVFQATVEPKGFQVQWKHNGHAIRAGSRIKMMNEFGFVVLQISDVVDRDTGEWSCRVWNSAGEAISKGSLVCKRKANIVSESQQPKSLQKIRELEQPKDLPQQQSMVTSMTPKFVIPLKPILKVEEGESVHLEAKLEPTGDPTLKVEWLLNGKPIPSSYRFQTLSDFGFCILDIVDAMPELCGEIVCHASNAAGKASTKTKIVCSPKPNVILEPQNTAKAQAVKQMEDKFQKAVVPLSTAGDQKKQLAPIFLEPLRNLTGLAEGDSAYFSGKILPADDSTLKVEWFLNGRPLKTGSRVKTLCDFGFVVLEIAPTYAEDSGEYVCRISNKLGEAKTMAQFRCEPKQRIVSETQLPEKMQGASAKILKLETPKARAPPAAEKTFGCPRFVQKLKDLLDLNEDEVAHFDCQLEPARDSQMTVQWFKDGEALFHSSRMKMLSDFGFVILEIASVDPNDAGVYVCKARNASGEASTECRLKVAAGKSVSYEWQKDDPKHKERILQIEQHLQRPLEEFSAPEKEFSAPKFVDELEDLGKVEEGGSACFKCRLEPVGDPSLDIVWLHNGHTIPFSNRIQMGSDFGYVMLDITGVIAEDSGEYVCKATNAKGSAETRGKLACLAKVEAAAPKFVQQIISEIKGVHEGDTIHLECLVAPTNDPHLTIQWLFNDKPLTMGHRFKTMVEFGYVALDILYAYPEDSGKYTCKATNAKGTATTSNKFKVEARPGIVFERQAPKQSQDDLSRHLQQYTRQKLALTEQDFYEDGQNKKPCFKTNLRSIVVNEGEFTRFECQLAPINDPNLNVEWFLNGKPVMLGHRFRPLLDFGYVALDILYALPNDNGEYTAKAVNKYGSAETMGKLLCAPKKGVVTDTQIPQGLSISNLKGEETAYWSGAGEEQPARIRCAPSFTIPLRPVQVKENEPARFEAAVSGHPRPKVQWFVNGKEAVNGQRYKLSYDGMHYLIIPQVKVKDAGEILVVAKNSEGECQATTSLDVFLAHDFRRVHLRTVAKYSEEMVRQKEDKWRQMTMGMLGEVFENVASPSVEKLQKLELEKLAPAPLESEELKQKFSKKRDESCYADTALPVDESAKKFSKLELEPVQLKPANIAKAPRSKEEAPKANLKSAPKASKTSAAPEPDPDYSSALQKAATNEDVDKKFKVKRPQQTETPVAAKDQVQLNKTKPKLASEPERFEKPEVPVSDSAPKPVGKSEPVPKPKNKDPTKPEPVASDSIKHEALKSEAKKPGSQKIAANKAPPAIVAQLESCKVELGKPVKFFCEFSGAQPLKVVWQKDKRTLGSSFDTKIETSTGSTMLTIEKTKNDSAGTYTVRVENVSGKAESSAQLTLTTKTDVSKAPKLLKQLPATFDIQQGKQVRFEVNFEGHSAPTVTWFKDNRPLLTLDQRFSSIQETDSASLGITDAVASDSGAYECVLKNAKGEARTKTHLYVSLAKTAPKDTKKQTSTAAPAPATEATKSMKNDSKAVEQNEIPPPEIVEPMKSVVAEEGQPALFRTRLNAHPKSSICWYFNDDVLEFDEDRHVLTFEDDAIILGIVSAEKCDEGLYKLSIENEAGKTETQAILMVKKPKIPGVAPSFTTPLVNTTAPIGGTAYFWVEVAGFPKSQLTWFRNGKVVKLSHNQSNDMVLELTNVQPDMAGSYTCRGTNQYGMQECSAVLKVQANQ